MGCRFGKNVSSADCGTVSRQRKFVGNFEGSVCVRARWWRRSRALNPRTIRLRLVRAESRHNLSRSYRWGVSRRTLSLGDSMATFINRMGTAGIWLAVAMCCGASEASAQLYLNVGPGNGNASSLGSAAFGTANIGIGGPGSATAVQEEPVIRPNQGIGLPLLGQQAGKPLGLNGNSTGTAQGSFSSAGDHPSSAVDSVTNTLMGPVSNLVSRPANSAANPAGKRKQTNNAGAGAVPAAR